MLNKVSVDEPEQRQCRCRSSSIQTPHTTTL